MDSVWVDKVGKKYVLGDRRNAREALVATVRRLARVGYRPAESFWSLRDVSFRVADGEALGIIGRNGAGKSTVLKILAGITSPTEGVSRTRGRVAALPEVGTGFHSGLTGRENIYLNGAILGMSRREIGRAFDSIIEFSGVERFLDTPVKRYSTGMQLRLGFAVAAHLDPDVLVVDEVLAVGDAEFQRKCLNRMEQAGREGRTVIFVSHDLESLSRICPRSLWLEAGRVREEGPSRNVVRNYLSSGLASTLEGLSSVRSGPISVTSAVVRAQGAAGSDVLMRDDHLTIEIEFEVTYDIPGLDFAINLTSSNGVRVFDQALSDTCTMSLMAGRFRGQISVPPILNVGSYAVGVWFGTPYDDLIDEPALASFTVHGSDAGRPGRVLVTAYPMSVRDLSA